MSLLSRIFGKNPKCTKNALQIVLQGISAERTRFELVVRNDPYVGLANRWFQPLTHLSFGLPPGNPGLGGQSYNNLFVLQAIGRKNKQFIPRANRNSLPRSLRAAEDGENLIAHVAVLLHALEEI